MIPFKEVAMLTSGLLARKGTAAPASLGLAPYPLNAPVMAPMPAPQPQMQPVQPAPLRAAAVAAARVESRAPLRFPAGQVTERPAAEPKEPSPKPVVEAVAPVAEAVVPVVEEVETGEVAHDGKLAKVSLRLDPVRHLKLRLASAHERRSGQQILLAALDAYLAGVAASVPGDCACLKRNPEA
jgi:hypothetical protein